jgi:hypothetical protein
LEEELNKFIDLYSAISSGKLFGSSTNPCVAHLGVFKKHSMSVATLRSALSDTFYRNSWLALKNAEIVKQIEMN